MRTPEMAGKKPFRCFNCNKLLAVNVHGECNIDFVCGRCKAFVKLIMKEPAEIGDKKSEVNT